MPWRLIAPGVKGPQTTFDPIQSTTPQIRRGLRWPLPAERTVRIWGIDRWPYTVDVEFVQSDRGPVATGVTVRRNFRYDEDDGFADDLELEAVSGRDVRRMPLDRMIAAALAAVSEPTTTTGWRDGVTTELESQRPSKRGYSSKFYAEIADEYRRLAQKGLTSPVQEIARRRGDPPNRVHQWVHRARAMGLLEPSTRRRRRSERG
jgi:hypothetical protein